MGTSKQYIEPLPVQLYVTANKRIAVEWRIQQIEEGLVDPPEEDHGYADEPDDSEAYAHLYGKLAGWE